MSRSYRNVRPKSKQVYSVKMVMDLYGIALPPENWIV
jgi:hypothetical protein